MKDPRSTAAYEFYRQMSSPKLKKSHPPFECELILHEGTDTPVITTKFINGEKWDLDASILPAVGLREEFFSKAEQIEDWYELNGGKPGAVDEVTTKSKGPAAKGGKK